MTVLTKGKALYPFWGERLNLITGLDPLGLQGTSEAAYTMLLPGISNLTNRMRYYGFYCWLIDFYFKREKTGNSVEQYKFIRRAELMVAIIMQYSEEFVSQITGSAFAYELKNENAGEIYDLAEGADKLPGKTKLYWKYPSGAFGQYYYGAMQSIGLITNAVNTDGDTLFYVSNKHPRQKVAGIELAEAFDETLSDEIRALFYKNIVTGTLNPSDIPELIQFFVIDQVPYPSNEWNLYISMLFDKDFPTAEIEEQFTFYRKNTILAILQNAKSNEEFNWNSYILSCYTNQFNTESSTDIGWYCYLFNEYWQYASGAIFWSFLHELGTLQSDQHLPTFVDKFTNAILVAIKENLPAQNDFELTPTDYLKFIAPNNDEESLFNEIKTSIGGKNATKAAALSFRLLFTLLANNRSQIPKIQEFTSRNQIIRDGDAASGLLYVIETSTMEFSEFLRYFIYKRIVYRHELVALRKMNSSMQSTFKFLIEDSQIRYLEIIKPQRTSPRLNALKNLIYDLNLIDKQNKLTGIANEIKELQ